jgi:hypothetical protein
MPTIHNLSKRQVKLLDTMWNIDGYDEYMEWRATQDEKEIGLLEELLLLADIDEMVQEDVTDAEKYLTKIMKTK